MFATGDNAPSHAAAVAAVVVVAAAAAVADNNRRLSPAHILVSMKS